jgi:hypothetical protein
LYIRSILLMLQYQNVYRPRYLAEGYIKDGPANPQEMERLMGNVLFSKLLWSTLLIFTSPSVNLNLISLYSKIAFKRK